MNVKIRKPIRVAIVGASGYTGEELIRISCRHPSIEITALGSRQLAGKRLGQIIPGIGSKHSHLCFENLSLDQLAARADVFFLALPHGVASEYAVFLIEQGKTVFDLSADFRLRDPFIYARYYQKEHPAPHLLKQAVYGLVEIYRRELASAQLIACPGCYPTSILLPCIPLYREKRIAHEGLVIFSISGYSGAGKRASEVFSFAECNESVHAYNIPTHRHLGEIEQELTQAAGVEVRASFTPHMAPMNRGLHTTISIPFMGHSIEEVTEIYKTYYAKSPFVQIMCGSDMIRTRSLIGTNLVQIAYKLDAHTQRLLIISALDNLQKGASGQAIQAFNVRFQLEETEGLV